MKNTLYPFFSFCVIILSLSCCSNPCSLSQEAINDLESLDSFLNTPNVRRGEKWKMREYHNQTSIFDVKHETYRFTWSTWLSGSEFYQIQKINDTYTAIKIRQRHTDTIGTLVQLKLSEAKWNEIVNHLESNNFWSYPYIDGKPKRTTWSIIAYKPIKDRCTGKNIHAIIRESRSDTTFAAMCNLFIDLKEME